MFRAPSRLPRGALREQRGQITRIRFTSVGIWQAWLLLSCGSPMRRDRQRLPRITGHPQTCRGRPAPMLSGAGQKGAIAASLTAPTRVSPTTTTE